MSRKLLNIALFFFYTLLTFAQIKVDGWSNSHLNINSYNGASTPIDAITARLQYSGTNLNEPNWKLSVQLITPFQHGNSVLPSNKIKLVPTSTAGQTNFPGPLPTIESIGVVSPVQLFDTSESYIVNSSNAPIYHSSQHNHYYDLQIRLRMVVDGGEYLQNMVRYANYNGVFRFTFYRQDNSIMGIVDIPYTIQIHKLTGTPPLVNDFSISISNEAENSLIEFNSITDYVNGKNITYKDGLTVTANTGFQLSVRSIEPHFTSATGTTLPLNIVNLQLSGVAGSGNPISLSSDKVMIMQGQSTSGLPQNYDINYSTESNDERLYNAEGEQFTTQLMFEITPR